MNLIPSMSVSASAARKHKSRQRLRKPCRHCKEKFRPRGRGNRVCDACRLKARQAAGHHKNPTLKTLKKARELGISYA